MKQLLPLKYCLASLLTSSALAAPLTMEEKGMLQGVLDDFYEHLPWLSDTALFNARHFLAVEYPENISDEKQRQFHNEAGLGVKRDYVSEHPDTPLDHVAFLLKRLFPRELLPNNESKLDPVRYLTPGIVGQILTYLYTMPKGEKTAEGLAGLIDRGLNPEAYDRIEEMAERTRTKWKQKKNKTIPAPDTDEYKQLVKTSEVNAQDKRRSEVAKRLNSRPVRPIQDLSRAIFAAIEDAKRFPALYPNDFVQRTLYAFGRKKAENSANALASMYEMLDGMQPLRREEFKIRFNAPFDCRECQTLMEKRGEYIYAHPNKEFPTTPRDSEAILAFERSQEITIPPPLTYANATYNCPKTGQSYTFSDCGETSLRSILILLLWGPKSRKELKNSCVSHDISQTTLASYEGLMIPELVEFFKKYNTYHAQQTEEARHDFTDRKRHRGPGDKICSWPKFSACSPKKGSTFWGSP